MRPLALALTLLLALAAPVRAETCPRSDALGTSRVMEVAIPADGLFVGTKSYRETLPLAPKEVVLTFDDGPAGPTTDRVLAALEAECVKATFFVVGRMAAARPEQLRRIAASGHTVGHHSMTHVIMNTVPHERGRADIEQGWRTVDRILTGVEAPHPATPFFRFPGFAPTRALSTWLAAERVGVFGADFWGSDWTKITSEALFAQVLHRLEEKQGGILLLHDIHAHTAAMVPALLREMKARGYRVVHIVPAKA
ncbi:MAG: polysaccharide deacetylase family protein [Siculibacillus sp.]|nr:polysaccharide deacetylase family protein [Siculibacillus sp.]